MIKHSPLRVSGHARGSGCQVWGNKVFWIAGLRNHQFLEGTENGVGHGVVGELLAATRYPSKVKTGADWDGPAQGKTASPIVIGVDSDSGWQGLNDSPVWWCLVLA